MNLLIISLISLLFSTPLLSIANESEIKDEMELKQEIESPQKARSSDHDAFNIEKETKHLTKIAPSIRTNVLKTALTAYKNAMIHDSVKKHILTVIDYSLPSSKQRMWVFDLNQDKLLYKTFVAHGKNSGMNKPSHFSNKQESKKSSLGTYITQETYFGSKGYSLNLKGLEKGFNDNAYARRVVVHGAWYVEPDFIKKSGRAGRSWGCPSVAKSLAKPIINTIKGGSVVFAYYPDKNYLNNSDYISV